MIILPDYSGTSLCKPLRGVISPSANRSGGHLSLCKPLRGSSLPLQTPQGGPLSLVRYQTPQGVLSL
jgi:hypothetical protein